ncbi:head maturation protease, ClpP-related [uncultured Corynebacterium sp.]|uniref:head maturation protease, ClpP-related n=1 Tax=uncultured Corynebacterium sp. TaxID=159447 RepID=UPI0025FD1063|nr:head maturation protease, ClpP-related [uncultured Corynebacterium sp.]
MSELLLFGEVGWEIKAQDVINYLTSMAGEDVSVRLNSGGGDVYEGIAVMNALRAHDGQVTVIIEGLAASAASVIACGGASHVVVRPNAEVMIHEAWTWADGNAADLSKKVEDLNRASQNIAEVYTARAGGTSDEWRDRMRAETWYSAQEALDAGLVDEIRDARATSESEPVAASYAPRMVAHYKYSGRRSAPAPINQAPVGREKETTMSLKALAQELGWDAGELKTALARLKNETVPISGEVEVSYPDDVKIVPTERIKVEPVIGDKPAEPAEGEDVAPVGDGVGTVDEGDDDPESPAGEVAPPAPVSSEPLVNKKVLDIDTYEELKAAAQFGWSAMEAKKETDLVTEVDTWIKDGRISASLRSKAVAAIKRDPATARDLYGANPKNTIPRGEIGYGRDANAGETPNVPSAEALLELAKSRRSGAK